MPRVYLPKTYDLDLPGTVLDWTGAEGDVQFDSISTSTIYSFANNANGLSVCIAIENTSGSQVFCTFPAGIKWPGGTAVNTIQPGKINVYTFIQAGGYILAAAIERMG